MLLGRHRTAPSVMALCCHRRSPVAMPPRRSPGEATTRSSRRVARESAAGRRQPLARPAVPWWIRACPWGSLPGQRACRTPPDTRKADAFEHPKGLNTVGSLLNGPALRACPSSGHPTRSRPVRRARCSTAAIIPPQAPERSRIPARFRRASVRLHPPRRYQAAPRGPRQPVGSAVRTGWPKHLGAQDRFAQRTLRN